MTLNPKQFGDNGNFGYMAMDQHRVIGPMGELLHTMTPKRLHRNYIGDTNAWHGQLPKANLWKVLHKEPPGEVILAKGPDEDEPGVYRWTPKLKKPPV